MTKRMTKSNIKTISLILIFVMLSSLICGYATPRQSVVEAKSIEEMQSDIAKMEKEQKDIQNKLSGTTKAISNEKEKQALISSQIKSVEEQLELYTQKIEMVSNNIGDKEAEISVKLVEIDENQELFAQRIKAMYISNKSSSVLQTLLTASSFSQFLNQSEVLKRVSQSDEDLIAELSRQQIELDEARETLETQKADLLTTKGSYEAKSQNLDSLYSQSTATEAKQKQLEKKYLEDKKNNEKEIKKLEDEVAAAIAAAKNDGAGPSDFIWPLPSSTRVTSGFGWRKIWGKDDWHLGIDIAAPAGTNIVATAAGEVILVQKANTGYGWRVVLNHNGGYSSLYAHTSRIDVSVGQSVAQGQTIAGVGTTGASTGNHLHFEIRVGGKQQDPMAYVRKP